MFPGWQGQKSPQRTLCRCLRARGAVSRLSGGRLGERSAVSGTLRRARAERGKAEQAHLNFYQKREDPQTQPKVPGTQANSGLTYLGKDSAPPSTNTTPPADRTNADRCSKLPGRHEEEARPSARAGRGRRAESPRPVLGNSGRLRPRERPLSFLKTATSAGARPGPARGRTVERDPRWETNAPPSPQIGGRGGHVRAATGVGVRP